MLPSFFWTYQELIEEFLLEFKYCFKQDLIIFKFLLTLRFHEIY